MKIPRQLLLVLLTALTAPLAPSAEAGWISLFDGKTLTGWKVSENPGSPRVEDGAIVAEGKRAHVFYVGEDGQAEFENFELELEVKTEPGANSGVYFQTRWQDKGWPGAGFEAQVNNTQPPFKEQDYRENKKTGSLYGILNLYKPMAQDGEWFTMSIKVTRPRVEIRLNGILVTSYTEPANPVLPSPGPTLNLLGKGTFALQCHDEDSRARYRNIRVRCLPSGEEASVVKPVLDEQGLRRLSIGRDNFPLINLRVHPDAALTSGLLQELRTRTGIFPGITYQLGRLSPMKGDAEALQALAAMKDEPFFVGLDISAHHLPSAIPGAPILLLKTLAEFDYLVATKCYDGMNDEFFRMSANRSEQAMMNILVDGIIHLIVSEPIDVYANVMVLPEGFTSTAEELWTDVRMRQVIAAAAKHGVAFEINRREPTPSLKFIQLAKAAGVKFTIGSDTATPDDYADWSYILDVQQKEKANLGWRDMWVPGHFPTRAQKALSNQ